MHSDRRATGKARFGGPRRLDAVVEPVLEPLVAKAGFGSAAIMTHWRDIVGGELAERTRPERVRWPRQAGDAPRPATLVVRAEGGDALEIQHLTGQILDRVNAYFGWPAIGKVAVRQAPVAAIAPPAATPPAPASTTDLAAGLERIGDPELRAALARLARQVRPNTTS